MDQYDQHGRDGGSIKARLSRVRRRVLAEDAIDAHTVDARSELHKSRWRGIGMYWTAPVRFACNETVRRCSHGHHLNASP